MVLYVKTFSIKLIEKKFPVVKKTTHLQTILLQHRKSRLAMNDFVCKIKTFTFLRILNKVIFISKNLEMFGIFINVQIFK